MTFDEIWAQLCAKKPSLKDPASQAVFTSEQLEKLLRQVYEQGAKLEKRNQAFRDLFGGMRF